MVAQADAFTMTNDTIRDQRALVSELYSELRKLAEARMRHLPDGQTLQPTALVHEVYLRLSARGDMQWGGRAHFFAAAAQAMQEFLVDYARHRGAKKRGGDQRRVDITVTLMDDDGQHELSIERLMTLNEVLTQMATEHPVHARITVYRYFGGLTVEEIAEILDTPKRTVERYWRYARAWLRRELAGVWE